MYYAKWAGLLPRIERTGVAEYGRSISTKAVWSERKANISAAAGLTNDKGGAKINMKESVSIFLNSSENLYEYSKKIKPIEGYQDIIIHGDKTGFAYKDKDGNETLLNVSEFTKILKESGLYQGGKIRLILCETAAEGAYTAQWFANDMGVEVLAPTDIVWIDFEGNITIGPDEFTDTGSWITVKPQSNNGGVTK